MSTKNIVKTKQGTFRKTGLEWVDLQGLDTALELAESQYVTTGFASWYIGGSVDAVGKRLHRLVSLGYVIRKKVNKADGRQARYGWRLSAKGVKAVAS